jgi:hypothetical protein
MVFAVYSYFLVVDHRSKVLYLLPVADLPSSHELVHIKHVSFVYNLVPIKFLLLPVSHTKNSLLVSRQRREDFLRMVAGVEPDSAGCRADVENQ